MSCLHLADIFNAGLAEYAQHHKMSFQQKRVCQHLMRCRTGALGYQLWECDHCKDIRQVGCSCRDRHCPRCQGMATQAWVDKQQAQLLSCRYFHLVFTLPHELNVIAQYKPKQLYSSLFKATWQTLSQFAKRKHQGQLGMTGVLHTWGQNLSQHIHLHCLIPAGVLKADEWQEIEKGYLYPVKALSTVFRAKMMAALTEQEVDVEPLSLPAKWCVYSKACLNYSDRLVSYLARYTRKGVMSESRLVQQSDDSVSFRYRDYADNQREKIMTLPLEVFIQRYLLHVLPRGFMRVRHFGFLASACRQRKLSLIRKQQGIAQPEQKESEVEKVVNWPCPACQQGMLRLSHVGLEPIAPTGEIEGAERTG
ncbi:transposase [Motilimonas sp. KMU-193]|uniref:IS91 family transposase n=1 Tax=Motilimonas sp. KMU-193 TaxID=3388668 RepID=UPI00396B4056